MQLPNQVGRWLSFEFLWCPEFITCVRASLRVG